MAPEGRLNAESVGSTYAEPFLFVDNMGAIFLIVSCNEWGG